MVKVLCFNIHGGYDMRNQRDLRRVHALMNAYDVDIGVFQEIETRPSRGGTAQDIDMLAGPERPHRLPALTLKEQEGWFGNLIVSRYPIRRGVVHDLETSKSLQPRNAVDTLIETPLGLMRFIGTHLSLVGWERWSEVKNLLRLIDTIDETEKNPLFLMGDMNEWKPYSKLIRHLNRIMKPAPCKPTFPSFFPMLRLDRMWYDHTFYQVRAERLMSFRSLSDHLPLLIEIKKP